MNNRVRAIFAVFLCLASPLAAAEIPGPAVGGKLDYNRTIRPLLSNNCFKCHGHDEKERQSGLRLDLREAATAPAESGDVAIVPGTPDESALVRRIFSTDADEQMPPPDSGKKLTDAEKELLKQWIAQGAEYRKHWSLLPPERVEPPQASRADWPRNAIDQFVLARLEAEGRQPSPAADKTTLIRRLTLDLMGLPPTPREVDRFLADTSADAYEKLVERLLDSPHYGERMALEWLDAARFADTHGYHIDSGRDMSRWREWVIDAFNRNLPFDQFTIDQLAGDLVPNATLEQRIASGFNRNHMINFEGGAIPEEYHNAYIVDRVNTTSTVWLGLTIACAQCHDHKYDPITQKEYYQLYAFFHNVPENGLDGAKGNAAPTLPTPTRAQEKALAELTAAIHSLDEQVAGPLAEVDAAQAEWEAAAGGQPQVAWTQLDATELAATGATLTKLDDKSIRAAGQNLATDSYTLSAPAGVEEITAIRLEALTDEGLVAKGPGRSVNGNIVLTDVRVQAGGAGAAAAQPLKLATASADFSQANYPVAAAIDADPTTGWAIHPEVGKPHAAVFELERPFRAGSGTTLTITLDFKSHSAQHQLGRLRLSVTNSRQPHEPGKLPDNVAAILALSAAARTDQQKAELRNYYRTNVSPVVRRLNDELAKLQKAKAELEGKIPNTMVMQESAPRETFMLVRGQYDKPGDKVAAAVPASLPPLPEGAPPNRLGLAQWLVSPSHPLTARVIVNRYWQMYFGAGLVKTSEDFGSQGESPTHPDLLDWLATEFIRTGWDVKQMQRLIVLSATYRQSSAAPPELVAKDPENRLLGRGSRFRLPAEFVRDGALAISGLLNDEIGGRSVSPYQPPGLWEELASRADGANWTAQTYKQDHGRDLYRRTMYTYWKRTSPPPTLATFDAPDRETCTIRRGRTNTPLQALVLMNDPTYIEAARKLAERILTKVPQTPSERIAFAFRLATARQPSATELKILEKIFTEQRAIYQADQPAAEKLLAVGESSRDEKIDRAELAAWTIVASTILNLDETITRE